ncbi:Transcriptional regulator, TetR family [Paenibacillus pasadenensis]|uniref:Transcriptional regulator, TetR family n=1 Tax=Paenibacillus pasadenensis TaxID=217090 RepID=A0A2N5NCE4_9BACL|nr:TetR/AcrR family transcriptional regulator [Paenibacillus pasadenensis]PLT48022.1 Transcriptional regulator, TetR family [Paenibacillus pasadenensis]
MTSSDPTDTRDKLMQAAIELMAENGFKGVSTKQIAAAAGFSEMTLFRQFGTKRHLIASAVERYHYGREMAGLFTGGFAWDLRSDLGRIGRAYQETMEHNRKLFLVVLKSDELADIREEANKQPRKLLDLLTDYFAEMKKRGKLIDTDAEAQAAAFIWMNYGAFMSGLFTPSPFKPDAQAAFLASGIELFVRGLTP